MSYNNIPTTNPQSPMWVTGTVGTSITGVLTASIPGGVDVNNFPPVQAVTGSVAVTGIVFSGSIDVLPVARSTGHTTTNVTASLTSQIVAGINLNRLGINFSTQWAPSSCIAGNAYLCLGTIATTSSFLVVMKPGSFYTPDTLSTEAYSVIYDFASGSLMVNEQT